MLAGGRADGLEPKDVIQAITAATGLDGEAIRNVRMLDRFAFLDVPAAEAERVVEQVDGSEVGGRPPAPRAGPRLGGDQLGARDGLGDRLPVSAQALDVQRDRLAHPLDRLRRASAPVAMQPGRSGTYAEKLRSPRSITTR